MDECIFCNIVLGKIPCFKVFEDSDYFAFLDISPRNKGHTLVIPKKHYRWVWDDPYPSKYFEVTSKIANALKKAFGTKWVVSCIIGEDVPHAHIWLLPRFPDDGHGGSIDFSNVKHYSPEEMKEFSAMITHALVAP